MKFELEPYHRNVAKEKFIADLKRVASKLGKNSVTKEDYNKHGKFHSSTFRRRFGSWFSALKSAGLEKTRNFNLSEKELLEDLIRVAQLLKKDAVTHTEYESHGNFSSNPFIRVFGSWFKALERAGLQRTRNFGITDEEYFKNLEEIWVKLGRQPHYNDIQKPLSKYSAGAYERRFDTWRKALEQFIKYINKEEVPQVERELIVENKTIATEKEAAIKHKTKRNISSRLKVQVLMRDGNKCKLCGITVTGKNIHFDHIKPWSKGGETVLENLQILCAGHNLAKGNLEYSEKWI